MINPYVYLLILFIVLVITPFIYSVLMTESIFLGYKIYKLSLKLFSPIGRKSRREAVREVLVNKANNFINQISSGKSSELVSQGFDEEFVKRVKKLTGEEKKQLVQNNVSYDYVDAFLRDIHEKTPLGFFLGRTKVFSNRKNRDAYFSHKGKVFSNQEKSFHSKSKNKLALKRMIIERQKIRNQRKNNADIYADSYEKLINKFTKKKFSVIM